MEEDYLRDFLSGDLKKYGEEVHKDVVEAISFANGKRRVPGVWAGYTRSQTHLLALLRALINGNLRFTLLNIEALRVDLETECWVPLADWLDGKFSLSHCEVTKALRYAKRIKKSQMMKFPREVACILDVLQKEVRGKQRIMLMKGLKYWREQALAKARDPTALPELKEDDGEDWSSTSSCEEDHRLPENVGEYSVPEAHTFGLKRDFQSIPGLSSFYQRYLDLKLAQHHRSDAESVTLMERLLTMGLSKHLVFLEAAETGNVRLFKSLLSQGIDLDVEIQDGKNIVQIVLPSMELEAIADFVAAGCTVDTSDDFMKELVWRAIVHNDLHLLSVLYEKGADLNARGPENETPLHVAVLFANIRVLEFLAEKGVDLEAKTARGWVPLHLAAAHGTAKPITLLATSGVDIGPKSDDGSTPLHWAALLGRGRMFSKATKQPGH